MNMWNNPYYRMTQTEFHVYSVSHLPHEITIINKKRDLRVPIVDLNAKVTPAPAICYSIVTDKNDYLARGYESLKERFKPPQRKYVVRDFLNYTWPKKDTFSQKRKVVFNWFNSKRTELKLENRPFYNYVPKVPDEWTDDDYWKYVECRRKWAELEPQCPLELENDVNPLRVNRFIIHQQLNLAPLKSDIQNFQRQDLWWIVPDSKAVMIDHVFLQKIVESDSEVRVRLPYELLHDLARMKSARAPMFKKKVVNDILSFIGSDVGYYKFIKAQGMVQAEDLVKDEPLCVDSAINCCLQLMRDNYYVVLLSDDAERVHLARQRGIPSYTLDEAKKLVITMNHNLPYFKLTVRTEFPVIYSRQIITSVTGAQLETAVEQLSAAWVQTSRTWAHCSSLGAQLSKYWEEPFSLGTQLSEDKIQPSTLESKLSIDGAQNSIDRAVSSSLRALPSNLVKQRSIGRAQPSTSQPQRLTSQPQPLTSRFKSVSQSSSRIVAENSASTAKRNKFASMEFDAQRTKSVVKPQAGSSAQQAGSSAAQACSFAAQACSSAAQARSSAAQARFSAAQAGSSVAQAGSSMAQAGSFVAQARSSAAQAGSSVAQAGSFAPKNCTYAVQPCDCTRQPQTSFTQPCTICNGYGAINLIFYPC